MMEFCTTEVILSSKNFTDVAHLEKICLLQVNALDLKKIYVYTTTYSGGIQDVGMKSIIHRNMWLYKMRDFLE